MNESRYCEVKIPQDALEYMRLQVTESPSQQDNETQSQCQSQSQCQRQSPKVATEVFTDEKIEYDLNEVSSRGIAMTLEPASFKIFKL